MDHITYTPSHMERATIYLSGAELTRRAERTATAGGQTWVFGPFTSRVRPESLTVSAGGPVRLLTAAFRINYLRSADHTDQIKALSGQLRDAEDRLLQNEDALDVLALEEDFLSDNRAIGGEDGIRLAPLAELADYYRQRHTDIRHSRLLLARAREELERERDRLSMELGSFQSSEYEPVGEIVVELAAEADCTADITLSYFVDCAAWRPAYEARVTETDAPVKLTLEADVTQTTGEDWADIPLTLSSGSPALGGTQPELMPWHLDFGQPARLSGFQSFNAAKRALPRQMADMAAFVDEEMITEPPAPAPVTVQAQASIEFILPGTLSVPSRDHPQTVEVIAHELPAKYHHYSVRKLDRDVFLMAVIEGWERLGLLEGEVAVFLGSAFVGTTYLDPRRADDTLELSLGRDKSVMVTRIKGPDYVGRTLLGGNNKATREWVLTARNTRSTAIDLKLLDQIPVSVNKAITVEPLELSGATHDKDKGELQWELHLEPGEAAKKTVKYEVTYPKNQVVILE